MTVRCSGAEFLRFYNDQNWWFSDKGPVEVGDEEATWYDDAIISVNGQPTEDLDVNFQSGIRPTDEVSVEGGIVKGKVVGASGPSLEAYLSRWRKAQSTTTISVECPRDKLDAIIAAIKAAGGKAS